MEKEKKNGKKTTTQVVNTGNRSGQVWAGGRGEGIGSVMRVCGSFPLILARACVCDDAS